MNRFKSMSYLLAAISLGLLVCAVTVRAAPKTAAAEADGVYQKVVKNGDGQIKTGGAGEDFGWHVSYDLGDFLKGYLASKDTAWLDAGVKACDYTVSKMSTGPDGYKGWVGAYEYDHKIWADVHVADAILMNHILGLAEVILADETLKKTYGDAANRYVTLAKHDFVEKWDKRGTWHEDGPYGNYTQWDMFCPPNDLKTWTKATTGHAVLESLPFNKNNCTGRIMLKLYRITGDKLYHDRAQKIFSFMKSRMQLVGDYYCWNYWEPFGPWDVNLEEKKANSWMNTSPLSRYQAGEVQQIVEAYNTGIVFDQKDIERIINTHLNVMWNKDKAAPKFVISNAQLPVPELTPEQQKARAAAAAVKAKENAPGCLWPALDQFSQTVRDLEVSSFQRWDTAGKAYFENVTLKTPPAFARLYSKLPATPFDVPFGVIKSITVASVMPCTVTKGKPSVVLCKARIPVDLEVAVYSADGKNKLLVLESGKVAGGDDGKEGVHMFTWDGGDPAGKVKLAKGPYRVRWTVADGYREFPVTVAE